MAKQVIHLYGAAGSGTSAIRKFICDKRYQLPRAAIRIREKYEGDCN